MKKCTITITEQAEKAMLLSARVAMYNNKDLRTKVERIEFSLELFNKLLESGKITMADLVNLK